MARTASSRGKTPQRNGPPIGTPTPGRTRLSQRNQMLPPSSASRRSTPSRQQAGGDRSPTPADDVGDSARLWTRALGPPSASTPPPRRSARLSATPAAEATTTTTTTTKRDGEKELSAELAAFQNDVLDTMREVEAHRVESESEEALWEKTMARLREAWPGMPDSTREMIRHMMLGFEDSRSSGDQQGPVAGPSRDHRLSDLPSPDEDDVVAQNDASSVVMAPRKRKAIGLHEDGSEGSPSPKRRQLSKSPERSPRKDKGKGKARRVDTPSRQGSPVEPSSPTVAPNVSVAPASPAASPPPAEHSSSPKPSKRSRSPSPAPAADGDAGSSRPSRRRRHSHSSEASVAGSEARAPAYHPRGAQQQFERQYERFPTRQETRLPPPTALFPALRAHFTDEEYEAYREKQRRLDEATRARYGPEGLDGREPPPREASFALWRTSTDPAMNTQAAAEAQSSAAGPSGRAHSEPPPPAAASPIPSNLPSSPTNSHSVPAASTPPPTASPVPSSQSWDPTAASPAVPPAPAASAPPAQAPVAPMSEEAYYGLERYFELVACSSPIPPNSPVSAARPLHRQDAGRFDVDIREFYYRDIPDDIARNEFKRDPHETLDVVQNKLGIARHRRHDGVAAELAELPRFEATRAIRDDPLLVAERAVPRASNLRLRHPHISPFESVRTDVSQEERTYWDTADGAAECNRMFFMERLRRAVAKELHEADRAACVEQGRDPAEAPLPTKEHITAEVTQYLDTRTITVAEYADAPEPTKEARAVAQRYGWRWTREDFDRILPDGGETGVLHSDGRKKVNYAPRFMPATEIMGHLFKPF